MIESNNPEIDVDDLIKRIRAEMRRTPGGDAGLSPIADDTDIVGAFQKVVWECKKLEHGMPANVHIPVQPPFHPNPDGRYRVDDLLAYEGEVFIKVAYASILGRAPDNEGFQGFSTLLRSGCSKVEILGYLRYSEEGRIAGIRVEGLRSRFNLHRLYRVPVIGRVARIVVAVCHLPETTRNQRIQNEFFRAGLDSFNATAAMTVNAVQESLLNQFDRRFTRHRVHAELIRKALIGARSRLSVLEEASELLQVALERKSDRAEFEGSLRKVAAEAQSKLGEVATALETAINGKVDRVTVDELSQKYAATEQAYLTIRAALQTRVERSEITTLTNHLIGLIEARAHRDELEPFSASNRLLAHNILEQERRLGVLLEEAHKRLPAPFSPDQLEKIAKEGDHLLDAFYAAFEDRFRGSRHEIKNRQNIYLPLIRDAMAGTPEAPVVDLGCGRGEWLEVLRDEGLVALGVDLNRVFINANNELGLEVIEEEALTYLRSLKANSVGAITAFHLIEHLPFRSLIAIVDEAHRVLNPRGVVIFETPNPANLQVGACNFYLDPTHRNPLPFPLSAALLELRGFASVSVKELHPFPESHLVTSGIPSVDGTLNRTLFGPQDYGVIGWKTDSTKQP